MNTQQNYHNQQSSGEEFIVTARKWRPLRFATVVGQEHIATTLSNAIKSHRIHHAYLFCGPRGVGKTTNARIFARALNCQNSPDGIEPCNECDSCRDILSGRSMDVIEIDGASNNSVDDIRKLRENAKYPPVNGKYKIYIIDEVHMLSTSAFNALLKTLEEPPPHLMFIFATTESHKVPATIVSRCQRFDFRRMEIESIVKHLAYIAEQEHLSIDEESLVAIAKKGDGSMRDAQSIFDQVRAFCGDTIHYVDVSKALHLIDDEFFFGISKAAREHDVAAMFAIVQSVMSRGYDVHECLSGLLEHFRNILTILATGNAKLIEASASVLQRYVQEAAHFQRADVLRIMTLISNTEQQLKFAPQPRLRFELLLSQLASMDSTIEIAALLQELREAKKNSHLNGSAPQKAVSAPSAVPPPSSSSPAPSSKTVVNAVATTTPTVAATPATPAVREKMPDYTLHKESQSAQNTQSNGVPQANATAPPPPADSSENTTTAKADTHAATLQQGWTEFVKGLPNTQASAKMALQSEEFCCVHFFNGEVLMYSCEKFMCDDLTARRAVLSKLLEQFYGAPVKVTVVYAEDISSLSQQVISAPPIAVREVSASSEDVKNVFEGSIRRISEDDTPTVPPVSTAAHKPAAKSNGSERLPIENTIIELFGAKKIPLASK